MISVLNKSTIEKLSATDAPYEVRDLRLKGLLLRVQPSGIKTFYCEYRRGRRIKIGRADSLSTGQARQEAGKILATAYSGVDPVLERKRKISSSFRAFLDDHYIPWSRANHKASVGHTDRIKRCFRQFLGRQLMEITALDIEKWRNQRFAAGRKATTVNRDLCDLKSALNRAVDWGIISESPIARVKPSRVDTVGKVRYLSTSEESRLRSALDLREERIRADRDHANEWRHIRGYDNYPDLKRVTFVDHLKPMVLLAINTGMRRGEIFDLTWEYTDLERRLVTVDGMVAKSKRTRHIPLNKEAHAILANWLKQSDTESGLVFRNAAGERFNNVKKSWAGVLKTAGITNFRWHDLRHHFASRLVMAHVDLNTVRELLGHSDYKMTLRYAHLAPEHKHDAVDRLCS